MWTMPPVSSRETKLGDINSNMSFHLEPSGPRQHASYASRAPELLRPVLIPLSCLRVAFIDIYPQPPRRLRLWFGSRLCIDDLQPNFIQIRTDLAAMSRLSG